MMKGEKNMKIILDSGCDISDEINSNKGKLFEVVPLTLQVDDKQFIDDDKLDLAAYISEMGKSKNVVKTAAPSPFIFLEKFKSEGTVFVVAISSKLSTSYSNAMLAKQMYLDEFADKFIHVFDSLSAACGETLVALKIDELIKNNLPDVEITSKVTSFISEMKTYFVLERYDNLVKSGRMGPYVAKLAGMIGIKPICVGIDGKPEVVDKAIGTKKAFTKLIDTIARQAVDFESRILAISHVACLEKAVAFKDEIVDRIKFKDVIIMEASGLISTYADRGGLVIAY